MGIELLLVIAASLLLLSIAASKLANSLGVPALLMFVGIGILTGIDGLGRVDFEDARLTQSVGVVALALILFSGGLDTDLKRVSRVLRSGFSLATLGVLLTALIMAAFAVQAMGFSWLEGLLLGAILSSTDAAAVFSVLRGKKTHLQGDLEPTLELESGSNDPMAVFLTIGMLKLLSQPNQTAADLLPLFLQQMVVGSAVGYAAGRLLPLLINQIRLTYEGLYPVLTLAAVLLVYGGTAALGGNGFLAVYLAGVLMGSREFIHKKSLSRFHDGLAWLMQITMFFLLGLLLTPSRLGPIIGGGLLTALVLAVAARPFSVLVALLLSKFSLRERLMISWVGLRGAAPIILATFPLLANIPKADTIFNIVFFVVVVSVAVQAPTIVPLARLLRVNAPPVEKRMTDALEMPALPLRDKLIELTIPPDCNAENVQVVDLGLPPGILIVLLERAGETFVPNGSTVLSAGDKLLLVVDAASKISAEDACALLLNVGESEEPQPESVQ